MQTRDAVGYLIGVTYQKDALQQLVPVEKKREVFLELSGIQRAEFFQAGQRGLRPELVACIFPEDYGGEDSIEVEGVRYGIYRTYPGKHGRLELYLQKKAGV